MTIELEQPDAGGLGEVVAVLRDWQDDTTPIQLHPGDLGWLWRFGVEATAVATRTWRRDGRILAVGELDEHSLVRLAMAPDARQDQALARRLVADLSDPGCGVLQGDKVYVEAPPDALLRDLLSAEEWELDETWTPLQRGLTDPVGSRACAAVTATAVRSLSPRQLRSRNWARRVRSSARRPPTGQASRRTRRRGSGRSRNGGISAAS